MTLVGLHGCKQAPGVTTIALALTAALDADGGAVLLEADAHGGDMSSLLGRPSTPGWVSLAAAGRHGGPVDVEPHLQALPGGGRVLLAPSEPTQIAAALNAVSDRVVGSAAAVSAHVVIDHGRSLVPLGAADVSVLVCHPTVAGVEQARVRLDALDAHGARVAIVVSSAGPYRADEVAGALSRPVLGAIPRDERAVSGLAGVRRAVPRAPLVRFAASLADDLRSLDGTREPTW
jgi:MinD-like ATPase involved in chromosome partitioning or flagellar assembly